MHRICVSASGDQSLPVYIQRTHPALSRFIVEDPLFLLRVLLPSHTTRLVLPILVDLLPQPGTTHASQRPLTTGRSKRGLRCFLQIVFFGISSRLQLLRLLLIILHFALFYSPQITLNDNWISHDLDLRLAFHLQTPFSLSRTDELTTYDPLDPHDLSRSSFTRICAALIPRESGWTRFSRILGIRVDGRGAH